MNVTGLRAFHAVAEAGSFTRAAAATGLSQPTLSSQVKLLEAAHEASLFDRKGRGVVLTPLGQRLFDITARLFAAEEEARALLDGARTLRRGHLRVAADSATHVMPLLSALKRRHAGLTFSLAIGNSTGVLQQLIEYGADIGVTARATSDPRLHARLLRRDRLVLFVPAAHELADRRALPLAALAGVDLVVRETGSVTREVFEARLAEAGIRPGNLVEVQGREAVREAVAAGFGIGIVFDSEFPPDPAFITLQITDADLDVAEYVVCLEARRRLPLVRGFLDLAAREPAATPR
jgi:aminoethylphosphonate catabolism LysR family transcriptional regulator